MGGVMQLQFENLPLVEAAIRLTIQPPLESPMRW
jgi:hypothetical protein